MSGLHGPPSRSDLPERPRSTGLARACIADLDRLARPPAGVMNRPFSPITPMTARTRTGRTRATGGAAQGSAPGHARRAPLAEVGRRPSTGCDLRRPGIPGRLVCGHINQSALTGTPDEDFAPTAPFAGTIAGARAAVITVAQLIGGNVPGGLRWRYNSS